MEMVHLSLQSALCASFLQEDAQKQKAPGKGGQIEKEASLDVDKVSRTTYPSPFLAEL